MSSFGENSFFFFFFPHQDVWKNTDKLDLPSISQVQTRGPSDVPYYHPHARSLPVHERLPSLTTLPQPQPQPQHQQSSYPLSRSSPRVSSISSATSSHAGSLSSFTSAPSSGGPKTPGTLSPNLPPSTGISGPPAPAGAAYDHYPAMNQTGTEMYYQHMPSSQAAPPPPVSSYNPHQQPPLLQPGPAQYPAPPPHYPQYSYTNGLASPSTGPPSVSNPMTSQAVLPLPSVGSQPGMPGAYQPGLDTTGQIAPPGMKPRVTATLWEDEGSLCFQVEARGICVARREGKRRIGSPRTLVPLITTTLGLHHSNYTPIRDKPNTNIWF